MLFEGSETNLSALIGKAAESVYHQTQPYRYAIFIGAVQNDNAKASKVLEDLALNGPESERPWAYSVWGENDAGTNDLPDALEFTRKAFALAPRLPLMSYNLSQIEALAGHDEEELRAARAAEISLAGEDARLITSRSAASMALQNHQTIAEEVGDFAVAVEYAQRTLDGPDYEGSHISALYMKAADLDLAHDIAGARRVLAGRTDLDMMRDSLGSYGWTLSNYVLPKFTGFAQSGDWKSARSDLESALQSPAGRDTESQISNTRQILPWLALAEAETGDAKSAFRRIGTSPLDCYLCLRMRARVDATEKNWSGAEYWFARAVSAAPSVPFAYSDWGAMLLAKGDLDAAIAKFTMANEKAPYFADPLEMWGEALIAKNRSDLARAKFAEADKYAPNWGRLHLKWGEALLWSGDKSDAAKQFAAAGGLDLTPAEKSELARIAHV